MCCPLDIAHKEIDNFQFVGHSTAICFSPIVVQSVKVPTLIGFYQNYDRLFYARNPLETSFSAVSTMSKPRCRAILRRGFVLYTGVFVKQPNFDNTLYEKIGDEVRSPADSAPFEVSSSWEWRRVGDLFSNISEPAYKKDAHISYHQGGQNGKGAAWRKYR